MHTNVLSTAAGMAFLLGAGFLAAQTVDLPTSKQLIGEIPGAPQRLNSLPITMAVSPDRRYVVTVNAGYGTYESQYEQSLAVLDTRRPARSPIFPMPARWPRPPNRRSTPAWPSAATAAASTPPWAQPPIRSAMAKTKPETASSSTASQRAKSRPSASFQLPLQQLAPGRKTRLIGEVEGDKGIPFPAAIAVVGAGRPGKTPGRR